LSKPTKVPAVAAQPAQTQAQDSVLAGVDHIVEGLSPREALAFKTLTSGGTHVAAAHAAQVSRKTVYEWLKDGHAFAAAYELWKETTAENARTRLLILGQLATSTIADAIRNGDARAAIQIVEGMGLLAPPAVGEPAVKTRARIQRDKARRRESRTARQRQILSFEAAAAPCDDEWSSTEPAPPETPDGAAGDSQAQDAAGADGNQTTADPARSK
jgi:hypothetical protein